MLRRFLTTVLELLVLGISAIYIYAEYFFRLVVPRLKSLEGEVILVTGAGNGLGNAICKQLVKSNAKLVLWDISEQDNKKAAQELRDLGADHVFEDTVDVSDRQQIATAASRIRSQFGHVTVLINNAGICRMQQFLELTPEYVEKSFQTNVIAHIWTLKEFLPHMLEVNKGHVVSICSTMGQMAIRGPVPYYATKHALHGLLECLKDELAHLPHKCDVKFTTAYPFFINTRMVTGECGLHLKFKFPSITPFMDASYVAKRIVQGMRSDTEYLYIPETFRIYLAGKFFLPAKLHRIFVDFFVDESGYSYESVSGAGGVAKDGLAKSTIDQHVNSFTNLLNFTNDFGSPVASWMSADFKKEK